MGEAVEYISTWTVVMTGSIFVMLYMVFYVRIPHGYYYLAAEKITDTEEVVKKEPVEKKEPFFAPPVKKEPIERKEPFFKPVVKKEPIEKKEPFFTPVVKKEPIEKKEPFFAPVVKKEPVERNESFFLPVEKNESFFLPVEKNESFFVPVVKKEPVEKKEPFFAPVVKKEPVERNESFFAPVEKNDSFFMPVVKKKPVEKKEPFVTPVVKKEPIEKKKPFLAPVVKKKPVEKKEPFVVPLVKKEQFLIPVVTGYLGINNQLVEYMSAAVIARATGRTLCLSPLFRGPLKHQGRLSKHTRNEITIPLEHRFDLKEVSKFVRVSSLTQCANACGHKVDMFWKLRAENTNYDVFGSSPKPSNYTPEIIELGWSFKNWRSSKDISNQMEAMNGGNCVGVSGLFPGHGWRGAFLAVSAFLKPSDCISAAVSALHARAFGPGNPNFLGVHWRFEESNCKNHDLGLCFVRCGDGSIISSGLHFMKWKKHHWNCMGIITTMEDIVAAILEKAKEQSVDSVYLATDGWIRGHKAQMLLAKVIRALRKERINVAGLWKMKGVPNFSDGTYFDSTELGLDKSCNIKTNQMVSFVEQEMCLRTKAFLGSGESTWSLSVFYARLATRKAFEIIRSGRQESNVNEYIIEQLLSDQHASGLMCRYSIFYNQKKANYTVEESQDEDPDGWLDLEACEKRITKGGHCNLAVCF
ncbi:uncharacterized protein LOC131080036 isoform X2 [Cryptomeria japonica]|nr:uncharacterized protein LOC131080036 isoform X2 [Cryptomeria japonica]